jgi:MFS family permease
MIYWLGALTAALAALVLLRATSSNSTGANAAGIVTKSEAFRAFQTNFVLVALLVAFAELLQRPSLPALLRSQGLDGGRTAQAYAASALSAAAGMPVTGALADRFGRRHACRWYFVLAAASAALRAFAAVDERVVIVSQALEGLSLAVCLTAFEAWLVCEHRCRGYSQSLLQNTLALVGWGIAPAGLVAALAAASASRLMGPTAPFLVALAPLAGGFFIVEKTWPDNVGDGTEDAARPFLLEPGAAAGADGGTRAPAGQGERARDAVGLGAAPPSASAQLRGLLAAARAGAADAVGTVRGATLGCAQFAFEAGLLVLLSTWTHAVATARAEAIDVGGAPPAPAAAAPPALAACALLCSWAAGASLFAYAAQLQRARDEEAARARMESARSATAKLGSLTVASSAARSGLLERAPLVAAGIGCACAAACGRAPHSEAALLAGLCVGCCAGACGECCFAHLRSDAHSDGARAASLSLLRAPALALAGLVCLHVRWRGNGVVQSEETVPALAAVLDGGRIAPGFFTAEASVDAFRVVAVLFACSAAFCAAHLFARSRDGFLGASMSVSSARGAAAGYRSVGGEGCKAECCSSGEGETAFGRVDVVRPREERLILEL